MVRYKRQENQLIIFADDTHPRWITTATILDFDTVATADKFGNIAVVRCCFISSVALYFEVILSTSRERPDHRNCLVHLNAGFYIQ
jgi:hypothetical protein